MQTSFRPVTNEPALDRLLSRSHEGPVLLFVHADRCGISWRAYEEVAQLGGEIALANVRVHPHLSRLIESRTGVRHESPQVLLLRQGQAVWSASHWAITAPAVAQAVREHTSAAAISPRSLGGRGARKEG